MQRSHSGGLVGGVGFPNIGYRYYITSQNRNCGAGMADREPPLMQRSHSGGSVGGVSHSGAAALAGAATSRPPAYCSPPMDVWGGTSRPMRQARAVSAAAAAAVSGSNKRSPSSKRACGSRGVGATGGHLRTGSNGGGAGSRRGKGSPCSATLATGEVDRGLPYVER